MGRKTQPTASGVPPQKPTLLQTVGAVIAGVIAVKVATYVVTTGWRLATRENPPQADEPVSIAKKALWIGLVGATTGAARQAVRDMIKPPTGGPA
ncbi:MAG TPA: hypothetical protein VM573_02930 [Actinomycetota bacterium]|jgi:hypothetical protein|nr:hypothetical protein [Actinomycetota bacterium]